MNFSRISLFQGIEETDCRAMMKCFHAYTRDYRRGDTVFDFGQGANTVGIVRSGIVSMVRIDEEGVRTILETLQENSVFGEVFTFSLSLIHILLYDIIFTIKSQSWIYLRKG